MTSLSIRFPGRRYHATPWGHHVNEGQLEWPPAPWRLLRGLLSVGFTTCEWTTIPNEARDLITVLGSVLPHYHLPPVVGAHSRHYMPTDAKPTLVFDTWAQVDDGELIVTWPIALTESQQDLLKQLTVRMNYLGRSESWVDVRVLEHDPEGHNCLPEQSQATTRGPGWEQVPLFAPLSVADYEKWRTPMVEQLLADLPVPDKTKKKLTAVDKRMLLAREAAAGIVPSDIIGCLLMDTATLRQHGWSQPPGSRRIYYWRRTQTLASSAPMRRNVQSQAPSVNAMLLSLKHPSGNDHALPSVIRTLPQGELLHQALVSKGGKDSQLLRGTDNHRQPLQGHRHAHLFHLDLDGDGHLDHCLIWAADGLDHSAQAAVRNVRQTYTKQSAEPLRVAIAAYGDRENLQGINSEVGQAIGRLFGHKQGAKTWISLTPFVPPRFMKRNGKNSLIGQVAEELTIRGLPEAQVEILDVHDPKLAKSRHFIRQRRRGGRPPPIDCGFIIKLTFEKPVIGPIALGYASHFGLGLFAASD